MSSLKFYSIERERVLPSCWTHCTGRSTRVNGTSLRQQSGPTQCSDDWSQTARGVPHSEGRVLKSLGQSITPTRHHSRSLVCTKYRPNVKLPPSAWYSIKQLRSPVHLIQNAWDEGISAFNSERSFANDLKFREKKQFNVATINIFRKMHLTPIQRLEVVRIYSRLIPGRSVNRARVTTRKAARKDIIISEKGVLRIMKKFNETSILKSKFKPKFQTVLSFNFFKRQSSRSR